MNPTCYGTGSHATYASNQDRKNWVHTSCNQDGGNGRPHWECPFNSQVGHIKNAEGNEYTDRQQGPQKACCYGAYH